MKHGLGGETCGAVRMSTHTLFLNRLSITKHGACQTNTWQQKQAFILRPPKKILVSQSVFTRLIVSFLAAIWTGLEPSAVV